ncbi:unnamed protein product, partial [marine sediment metagenome]
MDGLVDQGEQDLCSTFTREKEIDSEEREREREGEREEGQRHEEDRHQSVSGGRGEIDAEKVMHETHKKGTHTPLAGGEDPFGGGDQENQMVCQEECLGRYHSTLSLSLFLFFFSLSLSLLPLSLCPLDDACKQYTKTPVPKGFIIHQGTV